MKQLKTKSCPVCETDFTPYNSIQKTCNNWHCALTLVRDKQERADKRQQKAADKETRRTNREARVKLKTRSDWLKEAQTVFNRFIRLRDKDEPCISCRRFHTGQYHAGHYRSVGSSPELRFNENNNHKQCSACNNHLSGNAIDYRISLIEKIGLEAVEELEGPHPPKKYTIEEAKEIKAYYKQQIKELDNG